MTFRETTLAIIAEFLLKNILAIALFFFIFLSTVRHEAVDSHLSIGLTQLLHCRNKIISRFYEHNGLNKLKKVQNNSFICRVQFTILKYLMQLQAFWFLLALFIKIIYHTVSNGHCKCSLQLHTELLEFLKNCIFRPAVVTGTLSWLFFY